MPPTAGMPRDAPHQEQIVLAAIALLDEGGIESLTLRRLGSSLGSTAAALHWHIKSRHDLLLLAADAVWGQTPLPALDGLEWRPALLAMADNLRSTLLRHPWLLAAMTIQPLDGPARDRHDEHLLAVCEASGLTGGTPSMPPRASWRSRSAPPSRTRPHPDPPSPGGTTRAGTPS